jgi:hypothetical protein
MSDGEEETLKREIAERQTRLGEISSTVTREQLAAMTVRQIADLPPDVVRRALGDGETADPLPLTRQRIEGMTPRQLAEIDPKAITEALQEGAA